MFGKKVEGILKEKNIHDAIMAIDDLLFPIFDKKPHKLSPPEVNFCCIQDLEREVNNGGFHQFFLNSSGDYAHEVITALKSIGSVKFLRLTELAIKEFPNGQVPKNRDERVEILWQIEGKANPVWETLEDEFYQYEEDLDRLLLDYIKKNIEGFR